MFCAIATTIERCKTEGVVDVFQVVKALRVQKPGAVTTVVSNSNQNKGDVSRLSNPPYIQERDILISLVYFAACSAH